MSILEYLETHLPTHKAQQILAYLEEAKCILRITRKRKTKLGDFRHNGTQVSISVNHDTNTYRFLFTLVHEIAHLKTFLEFKNSVKPHGQEWKRNFKELFTSLQVDEEFKNDTEIYQVITLELMDPKACSGVNVVVEKAFAKYDEHSGIYLEELPMGKTFRYKDQVYKKLENRRTRVLCLNLTNNREYTINRAAMVEEAEVEKTFAKYDERSGIYLEQLPTGKTFIFRDQIYKKLETRRTRVMCLNLSNNRKYTINKAALVEVNE